MVPDRDNVPKCYRRPGTSPHLIALHHSSPDSHNQGAPSVLNSPLHPQQAVRAGGGSGLDVALSAAQRGWRVGCAGPGWALQAAVRSLVFVLRAPGEPLKGFRLGTDVV